MKFRANEQAESIALVPYSLEQEAELLRFFPRNVVFAEYGYRGGKKVIASAMYKPDFFSLKQDGELSALMYRNVYGGYIHLFINYDSLKKSWVGHKYVNGKPDGTAFGVDWNVFFTHFTMLGLTKGERCEFRNIEDDNKGPVATGPR